MIANPAVLSLCREQALETHARADPRGPAVYRVPETVPILHQVKESRYLSRRQQAPYSHHCNIVAPWLLAASLSHVGFASPALKTAQSLRRKAQWITQQRLSSSGCPLRHSHWTPWAHSAHVIEPNLAHLERMSTNSQNAVVKPKGAAATVFNHSPPVG